MNEIVLFSGEKAIVDEIDFHYIALHNWHITANGYAKRDVGRVAVYMHKVIAARISLDGQIDHENRNKLDNRRSNLRLANHSLNFANRGLMKNNTSGYKGVYYSESRRKYIARIGVNRKTIHIGCFSTILEAAEAYNRAAVRYFGQFACLNVLEEGCQ